MANKDASFGLKPVKMIGGAPYNGGQSRYRIAANYDTNIFQGDLVMQVTGGGVEIHAVGGSLACSTVAAIPIPHQANRCSVIITPRAPMLPISLRTSLTTPALSMRFNLTKPSRLRIYLVISTL